MSLNIDSLCDEGGFAVTDRRFILGDRVANDSSRLSKILNYESNRFHGTLTFVETPAPNIHQFIQKEEISLLATNIIQEANRTLPSEVKGPIVELASRTSFENLLDVYYGLFRETAARWKGYNPSHFPDFSYLVFDKDKNQFRIGVIKFDTKREEVGVYEITEDRLLVRGSGIPAVHKYFLELAQPGAKVEEMNKYFSEVTEKIKDMDLGELLFHVSNAYMKARSIPEIGGTFKVTLVTPQGLEILSRPKRCAMNTLSGAYVAGLEADTSFLSEAVPYEKLIGICRDILNREDSELEDIYESIARLTKQSMDAVTTKSPGKNYWLEGHSE